MSVRTIELNEKWDIFLNSSGNIEVARGDYATAQDVANAIRLFRNDAYFAWAEGVPHFALDLSSYPSLAAVRARYRAAALAVGGVTGAAVEVQIDAVTRKMTGVVHIETASGQQAEVEV